MATFTDRTGTGWSLHLTVGDFPRLRAVGIDLNAALRSGEGMAGLLFGDPETLGRLAWTLCEPQAVKLGLTPDEFAGRLDGPALESLGEAVGEAVADFFPRSKVAAAIKGRTTAALAELDAAMIAAISGPPRSPPGGSPGSSGSTPGR